MSNLSSSTCSEIIQINYSDGVKTIVITGNYNINYILKLIDHTIESTLNPKEITWAIDWQLQAEGLFQTLISENDLISRAYVINCKYPYSLGENETEDDIKAVYSNYCYQYKAENN